VKALHEHDHRRERDPEADERDVNAERQRLHLARLEQVGLIDGGKPGLRERDEGPGERVDQRHRGRLSARRARPPGGGKP
jgi:hypothetical protein